MLDDLGGAVMGKSNKTFSKLAFYSISTIGENLLCRSGLKCQNLTQILKLNPEVDQLIEEITLKNQYLFDIKT